MPQSQMKSWQSFKRIESPLETRFSEGFDTNLLA